MENEQPVKLTFYQIICPLCKDKLVKATPEAVQQAYQDHLNECPVYSFLVGLPEELRHIKCGDVYLAITGKNPPGWHKEGEEWIKNSKRG